MWLITSQASIYDGAQYSDDPRNVCASSEDPNNPTTPRWYNRPPNGNYDPWISTVDHGPNSLSYAKHVYIEKDYGPNTFSQQVVVDKNGIYVYIRNAGILDSIGCS